MRHFKALFLFLFSVSLFAQGTPTVQFKTIADLVAYPIPSISTRLTAVVSGRVSENDGFGGTFYYDSSSSAATNLGLCFKPAAFGGRWIAQDPVFNVGRFGADPTGVSASTAEIQNALDTASLSTSGRVFIPPGTFVVKDLTNYSNMEVFGVLGKSVLKQSASGTYVISYNSNDGGSPDPANNITNVSIHDITLRGRSVEAGFAQFSPVLNVNAVTDGHFYNLRVEAPQGDGIFIGSGNLGGIERHNKRITIENFVIDGVNNQSRNGISGIDCEGLTVRNGTIMNMATNGMPGGIDFEPDSSFNVVRHVLVDNVKFYGIKGDGCMIVNMANSTNFSDITFSRNYVGTNMTAIGVELLGGHHVTTNTPIMGIRVTGNTLETQGSQVLVRDICGVTFDHNVSRNSPAQWVMGDYTSLTNGIRAISITDNTFYDTGSFLGHIFFGSVDDIEISHNLFKLPRANSSGSFLSFYLANTGSSTRIVDNQFMRDTSATITKIVYVDPAYTWNTNQNFYWFNQTDIPVATVINQFPFNPAEMRNLNLATYDTTTAPSVFSTPLQSTTINGDTGAPSQFKQGLLTTYVPPELVSDVGFRGFTTQLYYPANDPVNSILDVQTGFFYRHPLTGSDAWGQWHRADDIQLQRVTGNYTLGAWDSGIISISTTNFTVALPPVRSNFGRGFLFVNGDGTHVLTITTTNSELINASSTVTLTNAFDTALLRSDGNRYYIVSGSAANRYNSGGGEVNTASNLGNGRGVFNSKSGVDLRFNSLTNGTFATWSSNANMLSVEVNVAADGVSDSTKVVRSDDSRLAGAGGQTDERFASGGCTTTDGTTKVNAFNITIAGGSSCVFEVSAVAEYDSGLTHQGYAFKQRGLLRNFGPGQACAIYCETNIFTIDTDGLSPGGVTVTNVAGTQGGIKVDVVGAAAKSVGWRASIRYTPI